MSDRSPIKRIIATHTDRRWTWTEKYGPWFGDTRTWNVTRRDDGETSIVSGNLSYKPLDVPPDQLDNLITALTEARKATMSDSRADAIEAHTRAAADHLAAADAAAHPFTGPIIATEGKEQK